SHDLIYLPSPVERREPHAPPVAEVRDRVLADARRERAAAMAREHGTKLRARAAEVGLEAAAAELKLPVKNTGLFDRRAGSIPTIRASPHLRAHAFSPTPRAPLPPPVYSVGREAIVPALAKRRPARPA